MGGAVISPFRAGGSSRMAPSGDRAQGAAAVACLRQQGWQGQLRSGGQVAAADGPRLAHLHLVWPEALDLEVIYSLEHCSSMESRRGLIAEEPEPSLRSAA